MKQKQTLNEEIQNIRRMMGLSESWDDSDWYWNKTKNLDTTRKKLKPDDKVGRFGNFKKSDVADVDVSGEPIDLEFGDFKPILDKSGNKHWYVSGIFSEDLINSYVGKTINIGDVKAVVVKVNIFENTPDRIKFRIILTDTNHYSYIVDIISGFRDTHSKFSDYKVVVLRPDGKEVPYKYNPKFFEFDTFVEHLSNLVPDNYETK